jgi:hypothetical protein
MKPTIANRINIKRTNVKLHPDRTLVLARPFRLMSDHRSIKICARVMALPESKVHTLLEQVRAGGVFSGSLNVTRWRPRGRGLGVVIAVLASRRFRRPGQVKSESA